MTIKYKPVKRGRPGHPEVPAKFYPSLQARARVTTHELAREASDMCTLSTPDMVAAIEALLTLIPKHLADGEIVELGDLGELWLYFSAEGIDDKNKVSGKQIKTLLPRLIPGERFKQELADVKFQKLR